MEEKFFFKYHLRTTFDEVMNLPVYERKWYIQRFVEQKDREDAAMQKARSGH